MNEEYEHKPTQVCVVDFDMSFTSMVGFMVKWAFASIPAIIIIWLAVMLTIGLISGFIGGIGVHL